MARLTALYLVGPVRLYPRLFRRALLSPPPPIAGSYWLPCDVGALAPAASRRQS